MDQAELRLTDFRIYTQPDFFCAPLRMISLGIHLLPIRINPKRDFSILRVNQTVESCLHGKAGGLSVQSFLLRHGVAITWELQNGRTDPGEKVCHATHRRFPPLARKHRQVGLQVVLLSTDF
jgi:hypothetical protein